MSDLKMHTANLVAKNIEKLTALFPNCITETRNEQGEIIKGVDFDLLRQELSEVLVEGYSCCQCPYCENTTPLS